LQVDNRENLQKYLLDNGIETQIHYPTALPFMPVYKYLNHKPKDFPIAHLVQDKILSLPMYPELGISEIKYITDKIKEFYSGNSYTQ
jgi:dTDP-4-amino-4,6-dideoxygalactose transaminase